MKWPYLWVLIWHCQGGMGSNNVLVNHLPEYWENIHQNISSNATLVWLPVLHYMIKTISFFLIISKVLSYFLFHLIDPSHQYGIPTSVALVAGKNEKLYNGCQPLWGDRLDSSKMMNWTPWTLFNFSMAHSTSDDKPLGKLKATCVLKQARISQITNDVML